MAGKKHEVVSCLTSEPAWSPSTDWSNALTVEGNRVSWEDKATGEYYLASHGLQFDGNSCRKYLSISKGNKSTGYSAKYYFVKYLSAPQTSKTKGSGSSKYLK